MIIYALRVDEGGKSTNLKPSSHSDQSISSSYSSSPSDEDCIDISDKICKKNAKCFKLLQASEKDYDPSAKIEIIKGQIRNGICEGDSLSENTGYNLTGKMSDLHGTHENWLDKQAKVGG